MRFAVLLIPVLASACADPNAFLSPVRVYDAGPGQYMITCVDSPAYCTQQAAIKCPRGFDITSNTINPQDFGRMTMVVRCAQ